MTNDVEMSTGNITYIFIPMGRDLCPGQTLDLNML